MDQRKDDWPIAKDNLILHLQDITGAIDIGWTVTEDDTDVLLHFVPSDLDTATLSECSAHHSLMYLLIPDIWFILVAIASPFTIEEREGHIPIPDINSTPIDICDTKEITDRKRIETHIKLLLKASTDHNNGLIAKQISGLL